MMKDTIHEKVSLLCACSNPMR